MFLLENFSMNKPNEPNLRIEMYNKLEILRLEEYLITQISPLHKYATEYIFIKLFEGGICEGNNL